jgi:hypothetical protein
LEIRQYALDLLQRGPEVVGDLLGQRVGLGEVGGVLEALVVEESSSSIPLDSLRGADRRRSAAPHT